MHRPRPRGDAYNVYDETQWFWMELAGAIFLPCQGYAFDEENEAIHDKNHGPKTNYYSVRLVRDVIVFDENDSQEKFAFASLGQASGPSRGGHPCLWL